MTMTVVVDFCVLFSITYVCTTKCELLPLLHTNTCSMYATSAGGMYNLVVCSFPTGVLVCVSQAPTLFSNTATSAENFAALLRH